MKKNYFCPQCNLHIDKDLKSYDIVNCECCKSRWFVYNDELKDYTLYYPIYGGIQ